MKDKLIRVVAMVLCLAIVFGLAAIFVFQKPAEGANGNGAPANEISDETVMLEIDGGEDIKAAEYVYYVLNLRENYESQYGETVWNEYPDLEESLLNDLDEMLLENQAFLNWGADEGFALTGEDKELFDDRIKELRAELGDDVDLEKYFAKSNLTLELFRHIFERDLYIDRFLSDYMTPEHPFMEITDAQLEAYLEEHEIQSAKHILIQNDEEDDPEQNQKLAEELLGRIRAGEDFDALMEEYTEDTGYANYPDGYTFAGGEFVPEFENTASKLEIGEVSEVVESDYGYHIIMRTEIIREDAVLKAQQQRMQDTYLEYRAAITSEKTEARNALTIQGAKPISEQ